MRKVFIFRCMWKITLKGSWRVFYTLLLRWNDFHQYRDKGRFCWCYLGLFIFYFLQPLIYFKWIWQLVAYYLILSNIADWWHMALWWIIFGGECLPLWICSNMVSWADARNFTFLVVVILANTALILTLKLFSAIHFFVQENNMSFSPLQVSAT